MKNKIIAASVCLVLSIFTIVALYVYLTYRIDYSAINHIKKAQIGANKFADMADDISVESVDDIYFIVRSKFDIQIHYGKQIINMNLTCFKSDEFHERLSEIGIEVKFREKDDGTIEYRVTYWGEKVEEKALIT